MGTPWVLEPGKEPGESTGRLAGVEEAGKEGPSFSSVKGWVPGESYGSTLDQINRRRRIWAVCGAQALVLETDSSNDSSTREPRRWWDSSALCSRSSEGNGIALLGFSGGERSVPSGLRWPPCQRGQNLGIGVRAAHTTGAQRARRPGTDESGVQRVGELMKDRLQEVDRQTLRSDPGTARWYNTAQWARNTMVAQGLLRSNSPRGVWELSEDGQRTLTRVFRRRRNTAVARCVPCRLTRWNWHTYFADLLSTTSSRRATTIRQLGGRRDGFSRHGIQAGASPVRSRVTRTTSSSSAARRGHAGDGRGPNPPGAGNTAPRIAAPPSVTSQEAPLPGRHLGGFSVAARAADSMAMAATAAP